MELNLPENSLKIANMGGKKFNLTPQYPLSEKDIVQAMKCLNGQGEEKRNILLLVDGGQDMTVHKGFIEFFIKNLSLLGFEVRVGYFQCSPLVCKDRSLLALLPQVPCPELDNIIDQIQPQPVEEEFLYGNWEGTELVPTSECLEKHAKDSVVMVISDFGAGRNEYDIYKLFDTAVFLKTVNKYTPQYVCLNPLSRTWWERSLLVRKNNNATQVSRHFPMFSLRSSEELLLAMDVLKKGFTSIQYPKQQILKHFIMKYGHVAFMLACHAALPKRITPKLLHFIKKEFFEKEIEDIEVHLSNSNLWVFYNEEYYQFHKELRAELISHLIKVHGVERVHDIACLAWQFMEGNPNWTDNPKLDYAQRIIMQSVIDPEAAREWLESSYVEEESAWFKAVSKEVEFLQSLIS